MVLAAEGYPEDPRRGAPIDLGPTYATVLHAGTRWQEGHWVTAGGRVMNLCLRAPDLWTARNWMEGDLDHVAWPGRQVRRDIGLKALRHDKAGRGVQDPWEA